MIRTVLNEMLGAIEYTGAIELIAVTGPIVRINPDEIHVKDPMWLDTMYPGPGPVKPSPSAQFMPSLVLTIIQIRDRYGPAAQVAGVPQGSKSSWSKEGKAIDSDLLPISVRCTRPFRP